jgi:thermitase
MIEAILRGMSMLKEGGKDVAGVRILPVDIYGDAPYASTFQLIQGVMDALKEGANPINMSLGSEGGNELLHRIIKEASDKGVLFFGAAGNEPTGAPTYPGAYPEVMAVTAIDRNGKIAPYANSGNWVDLGAPGSVIVPFNGEPYLVMGTSPATAWATGLATALKASGIPTESIPGKMESIMAVPPQPSK